MAVTAKDIAEIVGVSRSAVSAVLNGRYNKVSLEKRNLILSVANDLRYRPNPVALSLAGKATRTIGVICSPRVAPIYAELLERLIFLLKAQSYFYYLAMPTDAADELNAVRDLTGRGVDGLLVIYAINDIDKLNITVPSVCMSPYPGQYEIRVDLQGGFEFAARHLIEAHGHKKIAFLGPRCSSVPMQFAGYKQALKNIGIKVKKSWFLEATENPNFSKDLQHLLQEEKITAWLVSNDLLAARFMNHLSKLGLNIPDDAAMISFDGNAWCCETICPLTSLVFPASLIARRSVELLLHKIENKILPMSDKLHLLKPYLFLGGSCGCPPLKTDALYWTGQPLTLDTANIKGGGFDPEIKKRLLQDE